VDALKKEQCPQNRENMMSDKSMTHHVPRRQTFRV
jgi:hypothetical protein